MSPRPPHLPPESPIWDGEAEESADEVKIRALAVPAALALAVLIHNIGPGAALQRIFFGMWLHELGHATAAWLCGYPAFPGPWLTPMSSERSWPFAIVITLAICVALWRLSGGWRWLFGPLLALQLFCTLLLKADTVQVFILFAGDAGALVYGTLGMAAVFVPRGSVLHRGWLRWGFLVIGSAAFIDVFSGWWLARHDFGQIAFGENEGVGLSDPSRLSEDYGWSARQLVNRYVTLGVTCLVMLTGLNGVAVIRARFGALRPQR